MIANIVRRLRQLIATTPPVQTNAGQGKRLLVVDDEPNIVSLMIRYLQPHGYVTETAANGQEALDKLRVSCPDVLITDLLMPKMDGAELIAAMRDIPACHGLPVVLLTARFCLYTEDEARKEAEFFKSVAPDYVLTKPFNREELARVVALVLSPGLPDGGSGML